MDVEQATFSCALWLVQQLDLATSIYDAVALRGKCMSYALGELRAAPLGPHCICSYAVACNNTRVRCANSTGVRVHVHMYPGGHAHRRARI
jgi:hypothetical protein